MKSEVVTIICELNNLSINRKGKFGTKAAHLGELSRQGFNVPHGFVLSFDEYLEYLKFNEFPYSIEEYLTHNKEIQEFLISGVFQPELCRKLESYFQDLSVEKDDISFCVRSSSYFEDNETNSFAGMFESIIGLKNLEDIKRAIQKCYSSMFSENVLHAIFNGSIDNFKDLKMGVIIQEFIKGKPSGVVFSADTITMDDNIMIINAVNDICQHFVAANLSSWFLRINKMTDEILERVNETENSFMKDEYVVKLTQAAKKIEKIFSDPQDVEFTFQNEDLYILQSRPITTFRSRKIQYWSEFIDHQKTWRLAEDSLLKPFCEELMLMSEKNKARAAEITGKKYYRQKVVNGYPYFMSDSGNLENRAKFKTWLKELSDQGDNIFQDYVLPQIKNYHKNMEHYLKKKLSRVELVSYLSDAVDFYGKAIELHWLAVDGSMYIEEFKSFCHEKKMNLSENDLYDLLYQPTWLTKEREWIIKMVSYVKENREIYNLFTSIPYDEVVYFKLSTIVEGKNLLKLIKAYLNLFGFIAVNGYWKADSAILNERPDLVIKKIRACLQIEPMVFFNSIKSSLRNKERIIHSIISQLGQEEKKDFLLKLKAAQKAFLVNDDHCFLLDLTVAGHVRLSLMKSANILLEDGLLEHLEDIYFLKFIEIKNGLLKKTICLSNIINDRKNRYIKQSKLIPPKFLGKYEERDELKQVELPDQAKEIDIINGVSGLRKKIRGKVKIIENFNSEINLTENRILVLQHGHGRYLLPLINNIIGLIFDEGSPFDHPGIIAREMEIPTIYYTKNATKLLNDGDEVELDGVNGQVILIHRNKGN